MEVLVTLAIFSTVTVAVTDIFLLSSRAERQNTVTDKLAVEARTAVEFIGRVVRTGSLAYDLMPSPNEPGQPLKVRSKNGTVLTFGRSSDPAVCGAAGISCLVVNEGGTAAALTSQAVDARGLKFYIWPLKDPFLFNSQLGVFEADAEPRVTVALSLAGAKNPENTVKLQTTFTSRQYER